METVLAFVIGGLYAAGMYLMLRRHLVKLIFGLGLSSHAIILLLFAMGGLTRGHPPLEPESGEPLANPLPQALMLTAIVIGFGIMAFTCVLLHRVFETVKTDDVDRMRRERAGD